MNDACREIGQLLRHHALRLAVAESLTAGKIQDLVTRFSGASDYFCGGITTYSLPAKIRLLSCDRELVRRHQGVHPRIAQQMAAGAAEMFQADISVATTGFAEANPEQGIPRPFAWLAIADIRRTRVLDPVYWEGEGDRESVRQAVAQQAITLVVEYLRTGTAEG